MHEFHRLWQLSLMSSSQTRSNKITQRFVSLTLVKFMYTKRYVMPSFRLRRPPFSEPHRSVYRQNKTVGSNKFLARAIVCSTCDWGYLLGTTEFLVVDRSQVMEAREKITFPRAMGTIFRRYFRYGDSQSLVSEYGTLSLVGATNVDQCLLETSSCKHDVSIFFEGVRLYVIECHG